MPWSKFNALFVNGSGKAQVRVPKSCIESAEYIIQCIAQNSILKYNYQEIRSPDVVAVFGHRRFNITRDADIQNDAEGITDYDFSCCLPEVGEGIILLNKTKSDKKYNMHLGAVVARDSNKALISHMMENPKGKVVLAELETIEISCPEDFRTATFGPYGYRGYAIGKLEAQP